MTKRKKQLRLSENKVLFGVVGGFAEFLGLDKTFLRVLFAAFVIVTGFFPGVVLYLVAWLIMRAAEEPADVIEVPGRSKK